MRAASWRSTFRSVWSRAGRQRSETVRLPRGHVRGRHVIKFLRIGSRKGIPYRWPPSCRRKSISAAAQRHARTTPLYRLWPLFARAEAHHAHDVGDEDLAVADLAGARGLRDGLDGALDLIVLHHRLDAHLGQKIHHIFGAAIELGVALLPAEALDLGDGHAGDADLRHRLAHVVQLEGHDAGIDLLHKLVSSD